MGNSKAFTLIELLVVMAIMGVVMAIVAPFSQHQVEKSLQASEWLSVKEFIGTVAKKAFLYGTPLQLQLDGGSIQVFDNSGLKVYNLYYDYVFFQPKVINVNANGVLSESTISATVGRKKLEYTYIQFTKKLD